MNRSWSSREAAPEATPGSLEVVFREDPSVFDGRFSNLAWLQELRLAPLATIAVMTGGMTLAGLAAIHPIVTGTIMMVLFNSFPTGVADLVLMESMLFGWALGTMSSLSSVSIATGSAIFSSKRKAVLALAGVTMTSTFSKACR